MNFYKRDNLQHFFMQIKFDFINENRKCIQTDINVKRSAENVS